ncbi:MAG: RNA 3'-terminal phosphate cyclase [Promethearchaeota archaeon]|nr:MAG: RNA 3'-terminal phosphate cyclase [Candidatus Lokiarchaeota archaeon]
MNDEKEILEIDGSFGEGGGSILRLSAGFSILFNLPIKVFNIRANRSKPGLRLQHVLGLKTLAKLTNSKLSECSVGTEEITFQPNTKKLKQQINVDIRTAASIGLLLQPLQIACMNFTKPSQVNIHLNGGGTLGKWAPGLHYLKNVTYQIYGNLGYNIEIDIEKYGFYPKGGAKTRCIIHPPQDQMKPINLTELGEIKLIQGRIISTKTLSNANVAERIKNSAESTIRKELGIDTNIIYDYVNAYSTGVGLSLWAHSSTGAIISSGTIIGEKQVSSEDVGKMAANKIVNYINNEIPVDEYLSDQLIPLMAFIPESSKIKVLEITSHTKTNMELLKQFTKREYRIHKKNNFSIIVYERMNE